MSTVVVLHVGLMKSGTSFIQQQLLAQRDHLASQGVAILGRNWGHQVTAVKDALRRRPNGVWQDIVSQSRDHDGPAVLSMEFLGPAAPERIRRIVESLRPATVVAVVTVRDLNRTIVSLWQETIQNGRSWHFTEYVAGVEAMRPDSPTGPVSEAGRTFWRQQDLGRVVASWGREADRVAVVTVPPPGSPPDALLDRFAAAAGLPGMARVPRTGGNESLGAASVLALRRLNELLAERGIDFPRGARIRKGVLAKQVLATRRPSEPTVGLDVPPWLPATTRFLISRTSELGPDLHGDWADLSPVGVAGIHPDQVPDSEVTEAAVFGLAGLVEHWVDRTE